MPRHKALKTKTGIEGTFLHKRETTERSGEGNKTMHVGLGRQLMEAEAILAEEDVPTDYSPPCA